MLVFPGTVTPPLGNTPYRSACPGRPQAAAFPATDSPESAGKHSG